MTGWNRCRAIRVLGLNTLSTELVVAYCSGVEPDGLGLGKLARKIPTSWTTKHERVHQTPGIVNGAVERKLASPALAFRPESVVSNAKSSRATIFSLKIIQKNPAGLKLQEDVIGQVPEHIEDLLWKAYTQGMEEADRHGSLWDCSPASRSCLNHFPVIWKFPTIYFDFS